MEITFYGYAQADDVNSNDLIYSMVNDLETFFATSDFTYNNADTSDVRDDFTINNIEIIEGGGNNYALAFSMDTTLVVNADLS